MDLYHKYRPKKLSEVIGQPEAVNCLTNHLKKGTVPHAIMFSGEKPGTGKTSMARILARKVGCRSRHDFKEVNAAVSRGIVMVREIDDSIELRPLASRSKVWIIDEAHQLTKEAQNAFLKILEDPPDHAYIIFCTTVPEDIIKTVRSRMTEIKVKALSPKDIESILTDVAEKEGIKLSEEAVEKIVESADGSARKALVILHMIRDIEDEEEQLATIQAADHRKVAFDLVKALMPFKNEKPNWSDVSQILKDIEGEEPEGIRRLILKVCRTHMLKGGFMAKKAHRIYTFFQDNYYSTGMTGLVASCWEAVHIP